MTQEEKAKAYDEVIKRTNELLYVSDKESLQYKIIESIFPELKESEDEKIKRVIRGWIYTRPSSFFDNGISKEEMLAWLEKQDEKCATDYYGSEVNSYYIPDGYYTEIVGNRILVKKGEKKPTDKVEPTPIFRIGDVLRKKGKDYTFHVDRIQGGFYHNDHNNGAFFSIEEQDKWELVEQKPTEWNEEDNKMLDKLIKGFSGYGGLGLTYGEQIEMLNWLKSLKPQKQWKPTEEQMKALHDINLTGSLSYVGQGQLLIDLYNDLKQL